MHKDIPLALYKKIHAAMPIPCVDVVIMYKGKTLLCKRSNEPAKGLWWLVGGRIKKGETLKESIVRKVKQEVGFDVRIVTQLGTDETFFDTGPFGLPTHTINTIFLVTPKGVPTIKTDDQHDEFQWFEKVPRGLDGYVRKYLKLAYNEYEKRR